MRLRMGLSPLPQLSKQAGSQVKPNAGQLGSIHFVAEVPVHPIFKTGSWSADTTPKL